MHSAGFFFCSLTAHNRRSWWNVLFSVLHLSSCYSTTCLIISNCFGSERNVNRGGFFPISWMRHPPPPCTSPILLPFVSLCQWSGSVSSTIKTPPRWRQGAFKSPSKPLLLIQHAPVWVGRSVSTALTGNTAGRKSFLLFTTKGCQFTANPPPNTHTHRPDNFSESRISSGSDCSVTRAY